jgi:hypothetical protein
VIHDWLINTADCIYCRCTTQTACMQARFGAVHTILWGTQLRHQAACISLTYNVQSGVSQHLPSDTRTPQATRTPLSCMQQRGALKVQLKLPSHPRHLQLVPCPDSSCKAHCSMRKQQGVATESQLSKAC